MAEPKIIEGKGDESEAAGSGENQSNGRDERIEPPIQDVNAQEKLYKEFVLANQCLTAHDLAVYTGKDGSMVVVFTDPLGRSLLNCSLYLTPEIMKKLNEASTKG